MSIETHVLGELKYLIEVSEPEFERAAKHFLSIVSRQNSLQSIVIEYIDAAASQKREKLVVLDQSSANKR